MGKIINYTIERISSINDFADFRAIILDEPEGKIPCLVVSAGTCGQASGANDIIRIIKRDIIERNLQGKISIRITGCLGFCQIEPYILVEPGNIIYPKPKLEDIPRIINAALEGKVVEELLYCEHDSNIKYTSLEEIPFYKYQTRTILSKNQKADPIRILDYIKTGGYEAFEKAISNPNPEWIIREILQAELRGRGGAGFYTGKKWEFMRKTIDASSQRFIICNADEGDP